MLVFTRKLGEEFVIGGNIRVKIVNVRGRKVSVGVQAPENIRVGRGEIEIAPKSFSYAGTFNAADIS